MTNSNPIIQIKNLSKSFKSKAEDLHILENLNLDIYEKNKVIISGESGCGKSTLLNMIATLESVTSGTIIIDGVDVTKLSERELAKFRKNNIGLVFQFHYLLKDFNAIENIMMPALMCGTPKDIAKQKAYELLEAVNLTDRAGHYPSELSGGERQRIAVARALINEPKIIVADEPTGNLDEKNSEVVTQLLFDIVDKFDKTLVLVTHDIAIAKLADLFYLFEDKNLVLKNGKGRR